MLLNIVHPAATIAVMDEPDTARARMYGVGQYQVGQYEVGQYESELARHIA